MKNTMFKKFKKSVIDNELGMILASVILLELILCCVLFLSYDDSYTIFGDNVVTTIDKVEVVKENGVRDIIKLPNSVKTREAFDAFFDLTKYDDVDKSSIFVWFPYCNAKIYCRDKLITKVINQDNSLVKSGAYTACIFDVPTDARDSIIRIHIEPTLKNISSYKFEEMVMGRRSDIIVHLISEDGVTIIISLVLILNFLFALVINVRFNEFLQKNHFSLLHLSILGAVGALYFLTQTQSVNYFFGGFRDFIYITEYLMLNLTTVTLIQYIKYKLDVKFYRLFNFGIISVVLNVVIQSVLTFAKVIEFKEMIYVTHFFMIQNILCIFSAFIFTNSNEYPSKKTLFLPVVGINLTALIPIIYYIIYKQHMFKNLGLLTVIGLIILELIEISSRYTEYKKEKIEGRILRKIAMTDSLTGLKNRQSHEEFIREIVEMKMSGWILSADINNLKFINDRYGHIMGDKLIITFSDVLKKIQSDERISCFRIGGDEFFIFIKASIDFDVEKLINECKEKYSSYNDFGKEFSPSFAVGYSYYDYLGDLSVMDIYHISDRLMYEDKARYKKKFRKNNVN